MKNRIEELRRLWKRLLAPAHLTVAAPVEPKWCWFFRGYADESCAFLVDLFYDFDACIIETFDDDVVPTISCYEMVIVLWPNRRMTKRMKHVANDSDWVFQRRFAAIVMIHKLKVELKIHVQPHPLS